MDEELNATIAGCVAAHRRLDATIASLDDEMVGGASRLPGWTVGHVLTHLARNADSHGRMLDAALSGTAVEQYPGGSEQRTGEIEAGAARSSDELRADVRSTTAALEAAWRRMTTRGWNGHGLARWVEWPCRWLPFHRWREVELHHVDLGLGYGPGDWPSEYVDRELLLALATVPDRVGADARAAALAWLVGRAGQPDLALTTWQDHDRSAPRRLLEDPRVVTVFRSRLRREAPGYEEEAQRTVELARSMPGFVEIKTFHAEDGERVSLVTFASADAHAAWRAHPEHRVAQRRGRAEFYDEYLIQVCRVAAERSFDRNDQEAR
jgi:maleylpyruvate isomerase